MTKGNGQPCTRCGTSEWYSNGTCKECKRVSNKKWNAENPIRRLELGRTYEKENRVKINAQMREWQKENKEKVSAWQRRWARNNKEKLAKRAKLYYEKNPDVFIEAQRRWRSNHPDKAKAHNAVTNAVRLGQLPRASTVMCANPECEKSAKQYHHESYEQEDWLIVIPLCVPCHTAVHHDELKIDTQYV